MQGIAQGGKAVILWQLVPGSAQTEVNPESEANDAKGRLMIRWWIWNDDGDSVSLSPEGPRGVVKAVRRGAMERYAAEGLGSSTLRVRLHYFLTLFAPFIWTEEESFSLPLVFRLFG